MVSYAHFGRIDECKLFIKVFCLLFGSKSYLRSTQLVKASDEQNSFGGACGSAGKRMKERQQIMGDGGKRGRCDRRARCLDQTDEVKGTEVIGSVLSFLRRNEAESCTRASVYFQTCSFWVTVLF